VGEDVLLYKEHGRAWVVLHQKDRCHSRGVNPSSGNGPYSKLFLIPDAPVEVVKAAYKALALKYHPDRGGDQAKMQELNSAISEIIR